MALQRHLGWADDMSANELEPGPKSILDRLRYVILATAETERTRSRILDQSSEYIVI